jgi:hypothetical protein
VRACVRSRMRFSYFFQLLVRVLLFTTRPCCSPRVVALFVAACRMRVCVCVCVLYYLPATLGVVVLCGYYYAVQRIDFFHEDTSNNRARGAERTALLLRACGEYVVQGDGNRAASAFLVGLSLYRERERIIERTQLCVRACVSYWISHIYIYLRPHGTVCFVDSHNHPPIFLAFGSFRLVHLDLVAWLG